VDRAARTRPAREPSEALATIIYSDTALEHIARAFAFIAQHNAGAATRAAKTLTSAIDTLAEHPLIGARIQADIRRLVVSFGTTGYVVLYRFRAEQDVVRILAARHQRELDFDG
jgi:plasmid stabilization system protein ParE